MGARLYDEISIFSVADPKRVEVSFTKFGHRRRVYPFAEMRVGDYFEVATEDAAKNAQTAAIRYGKSDQKEFTVRRCPERRGTWICRRML